MLSRSATWAGGCGASGWPATQLGTRTTGSDEHAIPWTPEDVRLRLRCIARAWLASPQRVSDGRCWIQFFTFHLKSHTCFPARIPSKPSRLSPPTNLSCCDHRMSISPSLRDPASAGFIVFRPVGWPGLLASGHPGFVWPRGTRRRVSALSCLNRNVQLLKGKISHCSDY